MSKVRIINDETGDIKFVSPYVANQPEQLKQYGYRIEDLKVKETTGNIFEGEVERKKPGPKPKIKEELTDNL